MQKKIPVLGFALIAVMILLLPMMMIGPYLGKGIEYLLLLVGFGFALWNNRQGVLYQANEERLILFGFLAFLLALGGFFQQHETLTRFGPALENYTKALLPLALLPILYWLRLRSFAPVVVGLMLAIGVGFVMTVYGIILEEERGGGALHGSPVIFGDLAMLLGVLSLILSAYHFGSRWFWVCISAGILGVASSLLSGTRGGWVVFVTLPFFLLPFVPSFYRFRVLAALVVAVTLIFVLVGLTDNFIKLRVLHAYSEIHYILADESYAGGSLGSRLAFWEVAWQAFLSSPIFGIGVGEFYAYKMALVENGQVPQLLASFKHAHNEYLGILSGMGVLGLAFYTVFFVWLWKLYKRAAHSEVKEVRFLGLAGISTIICYLDFSLSESFLSSHLGGGAFYFLMTIFIYFIHIYSEKPFVECINQ